VNLQYADAPTEHLDTNAIQPYFRAPHLYIGFPTRFQPKNQQVEPVFMTSRDGLHFKRWTEPLIPITAPADRGGNRSNYMTRGLLQLPGQDRELSVYATEAYYAGPGSRVRRFTFRTDGFVSLRAAEKAGEVLTKTLVFNGEQLLLNFATAAQGNLRVEILDAMSGSAAPGFALADCQPLAGDHIEQAVKWNQSTDVRSWAGKPVRLRFVMQDADLYAMRFAAS
jgi:hypothetical protein